MLRPCIVEALQELIRVPAESHAVALFMLFRGRAGNLLQGKTVGIIGAGRIGSAYARMMVEGHKASTPCPGRLRVSPSRLGKTALSSRRRFLCNRPYPPQLDVET